jgi:transcriptional regulator with XRE-family HTH domain
MTSENLGNYVAERRKTLGLRQSDLAYVLGYTTQAICSFEMGKSQPSALLLPDLANALSESLDDLVLLNSNPGILTVKNPRADPSLLTKNLTAIRNKDGLSLEQEAEILGVNRRTVLNYEKGLTTLSLSCLLNLLKHDNLKASEFFYHQISPVVPVPRRKARRNYFFLPLASLAMACLVMGIASPLLVKAFNADGQKNSDDSSLSIGSDDEAESSHSSSSGSSSSRSSSNPSSSSSYSEPLSTSSADNGYLSPYIPGLKRMDVFDNLQHSSGDKIPVGSLTICFDSGGFNFENNPLYGCDFLLIGAPAGVTLAKTNDDVKRTLTVTAEAPHYSSFYIQIKAFAFAHQDEPCYGAPFKYVVFNIPGSDAIHNFKGLKKLTLLANGVSTEEQFLTPGTYTLSLKSDPENYLDDTKCSVIYTLGLLAYWVSLNGQTLTITAPTTRNNDFDRVSIGLIMDNIYGEDRSLTFPVAVKNSSENAIDSYSFPHLRSIYLTYNGLPCLRSKGGEYDIDIDYLMEDGTQPAFDTKGWLLKIKAESSYYSIPGAIFDFTGTGGPIHLSIPAYSAKQYFLCLFRVELITPNTDNYPNCRFTNAPFNVFMNA